MAEIISSNLTPSNLPQDLSNILVELINYTSFGAKAS
jgi:hypothetical protein